MTDGTTLRPHSPGGRSIRLLVAGLALVVFAATVGTALFISGSSRILTRTGVELLESVEARAVLESDDASLDASPSPLVVWVASAMVDSEEPDAAPAVRALDAVAIGLLATLAYLFASMLAGPFIALLAPLLLILQPQVLQRLMESGAGVALAALLIPSLILGLALTRSAGWARLALCAGAGLVGGLAVFAHHLGLWATMAATLAIFLTVRPRLEEGQLALAPLGLELTAILVLFAVAAGGFYKLTGMEGKVALDYLFGQFKPFHPPFAVAGTMYREVVDGGPPWWTVFYLWLVRTPLPMWMLAGVGLAGSLRGRVRLPSLLWLPAGPALAILVVAVGSGSPLYSGALNLLAPLAILPALLGSAGVRRFWGDDEGPSWTRFVPLAMAILATAHLLWIDARHLPHPSAYANVVGGGSGGSLAGLNGLYVEPTLDETAAMELLSMGKKVVVSPWGRAAAPVLSRYARESGLPVPKVLPGGALPALLHAGGSDPAGKVLLRYCNGPDVAASLTVDSQMLWCVLDPGAAR